MPRFLVVVLVLVMAGCSREKAGGPQAFQRVPAPMATPLERGETMELYSLLAGAPPADFSASEQIQQWPVLGKVTLSPETRAALVSALVQAGRPRAGPAAACFLPRHALRTRYEGRSIDFVICFECGQVQVFEDEKYRDSFLIAKSPEPAFDQALQAAKVPRSRDLEKKG